MSSGFAGASRGLVASAATKQPTMVSSRSWILAQQICGRHGWVRRRLQARPGLRAEAWARAGVHGALATRRMLALPSAREGVRGAFAAHSAFDTRLAWREVHGC